MKVLNPLGYFKYRGHVLGFILLYNNSMIYLSEPDAKTNVTNAIHEMVNNRSDAPLLAVPLSKPSSAPLPHQRPRAMGTARA